MKFIIYTPSYSETSGGAIVLHKLCSILNEIGHTALLWPMNKPRNKLMALRQSPLRAVLYYSSRIYRPKFSTSQGGASIIAEESDIDDSIVVYPEIVDGNPLHSPRYVRWLLHKPGFHLGKIKFSNDELYFSYQEAFRRHEDGMVFGGLLTIIDILRDTYKITNKLERSDVRYMIRKGRQRKDLPKIPKHLVLDGLSHTELSEIFNRCKYCYFYDPYTMYARYAALCGCIPIIVPVKGLSKEMWMPETSRRYGLAYGEDDIQFASDTRELMIEMFDEIERNNTASVERFVDIIRQHFLGPPGLD